MFYFNIIEHLFLFVEQLDQLEVCLPYSRLLTGIPILLIVFQNLRWNSNKTSLYDQSDIILYMKHQDLCSKQTSVFIDHVDNCHNLICTNVFQMRRQNGESQRDGDQRRVVVHPDRRHTRHRHLPHVPGYRGCIWY